MFTTPTRIVPTTLWRLFHTTPSTIPTTPSTTTATTTTTTTVASRLWKAITTTLATTTSTASTTHRNFFDYRSPYNFDTNSVVNGGFASEFDCLNLFVRFLVAEEPVNAINGSEFIDDIIPQAFRALNTTNGSVASPLSCDRVNIMGTIVQESAPYLYPFIIEYSLIGAAVIYVMWKHIGRNPRYSSLLKQLNT